MNLVQELGRARIPNAAMLSSPNAIDLLIQENIFKGFLLYMGVAAILGHVTI